MVVAQVPVTMLARRFRITDSLALGALCYGLGYGLIAWSVATPLLVACVTVFTVGEMLFYPTGAAYVARLAPAASRGRWMGTLGTMHAIAGVVAPLGGAYILARVGDAALWTISPVVGIAAAAGLFLLGRSLAPRAPAPALPTTPV